MEELTLQETIEMLLDRIRNLERRVDWLEGNGEDYE